MVHRAYPGARGLCLPACAGKAAAGWTDRSGGSDRYMGVVSENCKDRTGPGSAQTGRARKIRPIRRHIFVRNALYHPDRVHPAGHCHVHQPCFYNELSLALLGYGPNAEAARGFSAAGFERLSEHALWKAVCSGVSAGPHGICAGGQADTRSRENFGGGAGPRESVPPMGAGHSGVIGNAAGKVWMDR